MKVLHFYQSSLPDSFGGIETVIDEIASNSLNYGIKPLVLSLSDNNIINSKFYNGYEIYQAKRLIKIASTGISSSVFKLFNELSKTADIVHYHFPWPWMDLVHFATNLKKPSIVTYHSDIIRQKKLLSLYKPLLHQFLKSVDKIVATSPNYIDSSEILNKFRDKVVTIPIGINPDSYSKPSVELVKYWTTKFKNPFFLFIGVFRYYKGLHLLIETAKNVNCDIVIIGKGPLEKELRFRAKELKLTNLFFVGDVNNENKSALLSLCYGIVFPSHLRSEAFGVTLLEGALFGKPLISCEIGTGTSYINLHNETGLVIKPNDLLSLQNAINYLIINQNIAKSMGKKSYMRFSSNFRHDIMIEKYKDLYQSLL